MTWATPKPAKCREKYDVQRIVRFTADRACRGAGGWRPQGVIESYLGLSHDGLGLLGVVHRGGLGPQAGDAGPLVAELEAWKKNKS
jgi:hypothetical protein